MPPFVARKRKASTPPPAPAPVKSSKKAKVAATLDATPKSTSTLQINREFSLGDDDLSSLSDHGSSEFEDVALEKSDPADDEQEEDIDWEDAVQADDDTTETRVLRPITDVQVSLDQSEDYGSAAVVFGAKKGPSKIERQVRVQTHCLHVQFLLFHNLARNSWLCDPQLQQLLASQLAPGIMKEVERWRVASGRAPAPPPATPAKAKRKKRGRKADRERTERDWGQPSQRLEEGRADMSRGDPLEALLRVLAAYWRKRFTITAPGLRKQGYRPTRAVHAEIVAFHNDAHDAERHGERIRSLDEMRELAKHCRGSRDVGAHLFTALLRGLGIDSRLVASLQPIGFGWTKNEEGEVRRPKSKEGDEVVELSSEEEVSIVAGQTSRPQKLKKPVKRHTDGRKGGAEAPIDLDDSDASSDGSPSGSGDESVVDVTPTSSRKKPSKRYDRDLPFPHYWTEAVSPVTSKVIPVDPILLPTAVAAGIDALHAFEPRGAKADKAKQVMAYVVSYSSDGTAKDTTTRYLKRHMWPGKTKGVRLPVEKVPIYNKHGKIKRYEAYDWFKETMSSYGRPDAARTTVDDLEDSTDLVRRQPEKKEAKDEGDTLQSLKSSAEFVLERFLRREEAIRPGSTPVRTFTSGKGDKAKEENVFLRSHVERCLTAESWHKEGRRPRLGETPMKMVPVRAVTLTRKREVEEEERETGEKAKQGLYAWDQTEFIVPPPIKNGKIPKNGYGNIDCFVPTMVPKGAVHIELRGTVRICKRLEIDFAEAVTGFEFGNKRAVPVITGVVVAKEHEHAVIDAWEEYAELQRQKEEGKQEKAVLATWRRFLMGLRINARLQEEYGDSAGDLEASNPFIKRSKSQNAQEPDGHSTGETGIEGDDSGEDQYAGGFLVPGEDEEEEPDAGMDDLVIDDERRSPAKAPQDPAQYPTPVSMSSKATPKRRSARKPRAVITSPYFGDQEVE